VSDRSSCNAENRFTLLEPKGSAEKSTFLSGADKISRLEDEGIVEWISLALTGLWSDYVDISRGEFSMERTPREKRLGTSAKALAN
jgi:hypothetical protein